MLRKIKNLIPIRRIGFGPGKKFYITTAIDYVNASPHMGHVLEKTEADAIARWHRLHNREVYFLTGTDEHGAKVARSAEKAGVPVVEFVNENAEKFRELWRTLGISNNDFIRTSDQKRHWPTAQKLWKQLEKSGDIYKKKYRGLYCVGHEAFVTEKDLTDGKCADHGVAPEVIEEENYFFKLSRYQERIKKAIESDELKIIPRERKNEILSFLNEALEDVSFSRPSRDISWGVPVPDDASQTMYVWCDALTNYISALGYGARGFGTRKFKKFWPADLHVIGKDILRFHAVIWPGMLMSAGLPLPRAIFTHGFVISEGRKMSKTLGNVIDPKELIEEYGAEAVRYYLLRELPAFADGDITREKFKEAYNANLANGLGNLVSRTTKMIRQYFDGVLASPDRTMLSSVPLRKSAKLGLEKREADGKDDFEYFSVDYYISNFVLPEYEKAMAEYDLQKAADILWNFIGEMDSYIQDYEPFKLIKENKEKTQAVLWELAIGLSHISRMLAPFMPATSGKIFEILGVMPDADFDKIKRFMISEHQGLFMRKE